jgi:hypothetical protein
MGVMKCARNGCENIMCDRRIPSVGPICDECWSELLEHRQRAWRDQMTASQVRDDLHEFMASRVGSKKVLDEGGIEAEFRRLTGQD